MKTSNYVVRRMRASEIQLAIDWASLEGWNPGIYDAQSFYNADPNGFFIGLLDENPVALASAVCYDEHFAFCGLYIVKPEFRGEGYGLQLTNERLKYIGNRISGLDAVLERVKTYSKIGYKAVYSTTRYQLIAPHMSFVENAALVPLENGFLDEVVRYEKSLFPAIRQQFLKNWITQPESYALGYCHQRKLQGYAVIRPCEVGYKVGPLFADSIDIAEQLLQGLLKKVPEKSPVFFDVPELNKNAMLLVNHGNMQAVFETIRMYRNGFPSMNFSRIYAITSLELG